jgi:hypothetical protein
MRLEPGLNQSGKRQEYISNYDLPHEGDFGKENIDNDDKAEYIVKVEWLKTVDLKKAITEIGFFGNQNTVCRPTSKKWNHTIERLKNIWRIE